MYSFKTSGTCSKEIFFNIKDNKIADISYDGGCVGNLLVLGDLLNGMEIDDVIQKLEGVKCKNRDTSCPDQLAKALKIYKNTK